MTKKELIRNIAFGFFAEKGYDNTSIEDIASAIGLTKQALYSHFSSKKEIFFAVLQDQATSIQAQITETYDKYENSEIEQLSREIFLTLIAFFSDEKRLLFWKRLSLFEKSSDYSDFFSNDDWKFDKLLAAKLYLTLASRDEQMKDPSVFKEYYSAFMLFVNGYLDLLLFQKHDAVLWEKLWERFWKGLTNCPVEKL